jgi:uncharacterized protein (DUF488 family)
MTSQPADAPAAVLTVGHSNRPIDEFLALLEAHGVTLVADVRKLPGSRANPQFNADALAESLRSRGIGYVHLPGLGGLRRPRPDSPNGGWQNASFRAFADYMQTAEFEAALGQLLELARGERPAIMCSEAVPWRCHRGLIADALVVRDVTVAHLMTPTRADPHRLRDWAKVVGTRITYPPTQIEA